MKSILKFTTLTTTATLVLSVFALGPSFAASPGQLATGPTIYEVKDLTSQGAYAQTINASACDELEYSIQLQNVAFGELSNIQVSVNLPSAASTSNTSTVTATTAAGGTTGTTGTTTVNLSSSQSISYESGTTKLYDGQGNLIQSLPDGITASGVNVGNLSGSTTEYLNFNAKVNCSTPPAPVYTCDALAITTSDDKTVKVSNFQTTANNGATFSSADINWGDGNTSSKLTTVIGQTHQYSQDGTYTISATAHFSVNGQDETASGPACSQAVTFRTTTPPTVTPPSTTTPSTPTTTTSSSQPAAVLVNTGPGSVVGLFAGVSVVSALAYHFYIARRLGSKA